MSENVYAPPEASLLNEPAQTTGFYVVARWKFILLSTLSFGLYFYYWSYKNWSLYKEGTREELWPAVLDKLSTHFAHLAYLSAFAVALLPFRAYVASEGQQLINLAANDPEGLSNNRLNAWNFLIIVPGVCLWVMVLLGIWVTFR